MTFLNRNKYLIGLCATFCTVGVCVYLKRKKKIKSNNDYYELTLKDRINSSTFSSFISSKESPYKIFYEKLQKIKDDKPLRINIETHGGSVIWCLKICNIIKQRKNEVVVYVKDYAHSAGTIISLCADKLYMSEIASLSAIDPQEPLIGNIFSFPIKEVSKILSGDIKENISNRYDKMSNHYIGQIKKFINNKYSEEAKDNIIDKMYNKPSDHSVLFFKDDLLNIGLNIEPLVSEL